jgi:hypothetical protein
MKNDKVVVKVGATSKVGFTGLLTIVFIVLKLLGKISWSWIWVLSPLWIPTAILVLVLVIRVIAARKN